MSYKPLVPPVLRRVAAPALLVLHRVAAPGLLVLLATLVVLAAAAPVSAQTVRGRVMEEDGTPVSTATVELRDAAGQPTARTVTDVHGAFLLRATTGGPHRIRVLRLGLAHPLERGVEVPTEGEIRIDLVARPDPVILPEVAVDADRREPFLEAQGFYRRSENQLGTFFDRDVIERLRPQRVDDLLRRIPGVRFRYDHLGRRFPYFRDPLGAYSTPCYPLVFIDGMEIGGTGGYVSGLIDPRDVAGMEVYQGGATVPVRFARVGHACGVIAFWTRSR